MVFFMNRDALFSGDNLFPINFFAVRLYDVSSTFWRIFTVIQWRENTSEDRPVTEEEIKKSFQ
jgi:hypothetical protein